MKSLFKLYLAEVLNKKRLIFILIFISSLIYFLDAGFYYLLIINLILLIFLFFKYRRFFVIILILTIIIGARISFNKIINRIDQENISFDCKVNKVIHYKDYDLVFIRHNFNNYYYREKSLNKINSGMVINIKGQVSKTNKEKIPFDFNEENYLRHHNLTGFIKNAETEIKRSGFSLYLIHEKIYLNIIKNHPEKYSGILSALTIGEKSGLNSELNEQIQTIGIGHLFVISGLHIELIAGFLLIILKKLKDKKKNLIVFVILIIYYLICAFLVSILRVLLSFIFNKFLNLKLDNTAKIILSSLIVLLINPFYLFSYSFLLSYLIVFGIHLIEPFLNKKKGIKSYLTNSLKISLTSLIISLPIMMKMGTEINLLSIIFNLFFIPFVSYLILPLSFISLLFPVFGFIYGYFLELFLFITNKFSQLKIFQFIIPRISLFNSFYYNQVLELIMAIIYLFIFIILLRKISLKRSISFLLIIFFYLLMVKINYHNRIYFMSLSIGDAIVIQERFLKTTILIDTGDGKNNELVDFIKRIGIKNIDAVIISHGDDDHIGGLKKIVENFKVKNIYLSYFDDTSKNYILNNKIETTKINYVKKGDLIQINDFCFQVLSPKEKENSPNNNSLVLYAKIFGLSYLFTGDIEKEIENNFNYNLDVDIFKVAHHGSNTSSTINFLQKIKPKIAIAMNGYHNMFGFPKKEIVDRFKELKIPLYNTIDKGTIYLSQGINKNKIQINTTFEG